jgi:hypothetical protein
MRKSIQALLGVAALLPLFGQGCALQQEGQVNVSGGTESKVDATVNATLSGAEDVAQQERDGDSDADMVGNDQAELDAYVQTQYELK